ncbi:transmembrane and coiled-coil domains protein 2 isoform X1 [Anopheles coustani]|uniref:transmembrane and coiled-coil domains protein 2 isoform X1 n=1 Tax=Anopheles coustani TaxID=139045 RepID=UPI0026595F37|nr:transmembrane and coiled-coil domains protein 2 isoform X1 [Anopheles coustani]
MDLHDTAQAAAAAAAGASSSSTESSLLTAARAREGSNQGSGFPTEGGTFDCGDSSSANRSRLEQQQHYESNESHYRRIRSPARHPQRQQRLGSNDSSGGGGGGGSGGSRRDKHSRERAREGSITTGSGGPLEMTTATMEMTLTTATTTAPATGNTSSSTASTTVAGGGGGSGVGFSVGSLEEMMRGTMAVDYGNLSGVGPLLEEVDGNLTTISQHSNDSIERTMVPGAVGQTSSQAPHHKGHSRGSSAPLAYDRITTKIACTKEMIRKEQEARDSNVNEYLKMAANADKQQLQRMKAVFEKKNQKSANNISQLQKKLESYNKRYKDMQQTQQKQQAQQAQQAQQQQQSQLQQAAAAAGLLLQQQQQQQQQHQAALSQPGGGSQTLPSNIQHLVAATGQQQSFLQPREMLRDVGQGLRNVGGNIRHGVTGLSATVISKPRKFAHLIRNKFGSADNINQLTSTWYTGSAAEGDISGIDVSASTEMGQQTTPNSSAAGGHHSHHPHNASTSDSEGRRGMAQGQQHQHHHQQLHGVASGGHRHHAPGPGGKYSEHDSECSSVTSDSIPLGSDKHRLSCSQRCVNYKALAELREEYQKQKERLDRAELIQKDVTELSMALENERYRADRLEEQINDLSELHQNERENLKQAIADLEEKVQYQSDERLRDVNEILENCQTRISKMEQLSQQQYVTVEGIYNSNARAVVVKLINVVLTVLQVVLLLVATVAGIIVPFLKTRLRVLTTLLCTLALIAIVRQWPDVRDTGVHLIRILRSQVINDAV